MLMRTTLLLDDETWTAARQLAHRFGCSTTEAVRRSVLAHRDTLLGVPEARRVERVRILERLFRLFEGHNVTGETRRLKEQDEGF